jgi:hypothetical protein
MPSHLEMRDGIKSCRSACLSALNFQPRPPTSPPPQSQSEGGWMAPFLIRALHVLADSGLVSFPRHDPHHHHHHNTNNNHPDIRAGETAAAAKPAPAAAAATASFSAASAASATALRIHPLLVGPHQAIANRSVGQLLALDRQPVPGAAAVAGAAAESQQSAAAEEAFEDAVAAAEAAATAPESAPAAAVAAAAGKPTPTAAASASAPLLDIMSQDWPGLPFLSGLAAFERRAVFSTAGGDHLIPWPSSSLRSADELPAVEGGGWLAWGAVVTEDGRRFDSSLADESNSAQEAAAAAGTAADAAGTAAGTANAGGAAGNAARPRCLGMRGRLAALQRLPWRRFDVAWPAWLPGSSHNSIFMHGPGGGFGGVVADTVVEVLLGAQRGGAYGGGGAVTGAAGASGDEAFWSVDSR